MPVNAIHRIYQDREGYIWYGTVNGLCRDDGYQVQVFRSDFNRRGLLANNLVECITEDGDGCIWFGTDKGAYRMSKRDYRVEPVGHPLLDGRILRSAPSPELFVCGECPDFRFAAERARRVSPGERVTLRLQFPSMR